MSGRNITAYLQLIRENRFLDEELNRMQALEDKAELEALGLGFSYGQLSKVKLSCLKYGGSYLAILEEAIRIRNEERSITSGVVE